MSTLRIRASDIRAGDLLDGKVVRRVGGGHLTPGGEARYPMELQFEGESEGAVWVIPVYAEVTVQRRVLDLIEGDG